MLPGKTYTPTDYLQMAWRRRWFIAVPALIIASTTAVVAMFLPDRYRASTMVMIVPQRVPSGFVQSTVTNPLAERLDMISQQILSRTRLERIVQEFNLYPRERRTMILEDVIEQMRKDIKLEVDADPRRRDRAANFRVSFESPMHARRCVSPNGSDRSSFRRTSRTASCWPTRPISSWKRSSRKPNAGCSITRRSCRSSGSATTASCPSRCSPTSR
jgi:hypothetical protein